MIVVIHGEGLSDKRCLALFTVKAFVMPLPRLKGNILRIRFARLSKNRLIAFIALWCEFLAETVRAKTFPFLEVKTRVVDRFAASRAGEALRVPGFVTVEQAPALYYLVASGASRSKGFLVAVVAVDVVVLRHKFLGADVLVAHLADEALVVPLFTLVTEPFGTRFDDLPASRARPGEMLLVTFQAAHHTVPVSEGLVR